MSITVEETGSIHFDGYGGGFGITVEESVAAGSITNHGTIVVPSVGVHVAGSSAAITNSGIIMGGRYDAELGNVHDGQGILVTGGVVNGGIVNQADGVIRASDTAISIVDATVNGSIVNAGIVGGVSSYGGALDEAYGGGIVVANSVIHGDIRNSGSISSMDSYSYGGYGYGYGLSADGNGISVVDGARVNGDIVNDKIDGATGSITAARSGIEVSGWEWVDGMDGPDTAVYARVEGDIVNKGTITSATGAYWNEGDGINVGDGATVTGDILNTGSISTGKMYDDGEGEQYWEGFGRGIAVVDGAQVQGSIVNGRDGDDAGSIVSAGAGIHVAGVTWMEGGEGNAQYARVNGGIFNKGTITTKTSMYGDSSDGIYVGEGASVGEDISNVAGAVIHTTGGHGVRIESATVGGSILNAGTITAERGEMIYARAPGALGGATHGIKVADRSNVEGSIINQATGTITADNAGIFVGGSSYYPLDIDGGEGNTNTTIAGSIVNFGTINSGLSVDGGEGYYYDYGGEFLIGDGIRVSDGATVGGDVRNEAGAQILATGAGIRIDAASVTGAVVNSGTITADALAYGDYYYGGGISGALAVVNSEVGSIVNSYGGVITATPDADSYMYGNGVGIGVAYSLVRNGIVNAGHAEGVAGLGIVGSEIQSGGIVNQRTGVIRGEAYGGYIGGTRVVGDVVNHGSIEGGYAGLMIMGGYFGPTLLSDDPSGYGDTITGNLINTGTIVAQEGYMGMGLFGAQVSGVIENSGTIRSAGEYGGVGLQMLASSASRLVNSATGTIEGAEGLSMFDARLSGSLSNEGVIAGHGYGNAVSLYYSTVGGDIVNGRNGRITAANGNGLVIEGAEGEGEHSATGIVNRGLISGAGSSSMLYGMTLMDADPSGSAGIALRNTSIGSGGIVNEATGTISGSDVGLDIMWSKIDGGIANSGTISGSADGAGIRLEGSTVTGGIDNSGTISGGHAIEVVENMYMRGAEEAAPLVVNNSGLLDGAVTIGTGVLNLNGDKARVTGLVEGGALDVNVNGKFASENSFNVAFFDVAKGGVFTAGHDVTASGGLRNSGTLSVLAAKPFTMTGEYTQTTDGIYRTQVASQTSYGQMKVVGAANLPSLAKIDVDVTRGAQLVLNSTLPGVIQSEQLTASTFAVTDNSYLYNFEGVVNGNNVDLTVRKGASVYESTTENRNLPGGNAARILDRLMEGGGSDDMFTVLTALGGLPTSGAVSDAVTQTLPLLVGASGSAVTNSLNTVGRIVQARQESNFGLSAGDGFITDRQAWVKPFGSWARQDNRDGVFGYKADTGGVVFGADGVVSEKDRVGVAFAYAKTSVDGNNPVASQRASIDTYQAVVYGSHSFDERTDLSWQAEVGTNSTDAHRNISFGGIERRADSSYRGLNGRLGLGVGRMLQLNEKTSIAPSVRLDYSTIKNESYTERGAGALSLRVEGQRTEELVLGLDSKLSHRLDNGATLLGNLGVGYDLLAERSSITSSYVGGGAAFTTEGARVNPWVVRGGAGVLFHRGTGMEISARYDVDVQRSFTNQSVSVKLRKAF